MAETSVAATLIGDVVRSKRHGDRVALQRTVTDALHAVNTRVPPVQPLDATIGDEFQGTYASLADAVRASLLLRLTLLPAVDTRYGIGFGELTVFDADRRPLSQDGPGWWAAREAIEHVHRQQQERAAAQGTRTWFQVQEGRATPELVAFVNAFLVCRDAVLHRASPRNLELLRGWVLGRTQQELADEQGVTQSAVSQRLTRLGAVALRESDRLLAAVPPVPS